MASQELSQAEINEMSNLGSPNSVFQRAGTSGGLTNFGAANMVSGGSQSPTQTSSLMNSSVPLAPSGSTTQTVLPEWYTNYAQDILSRQTAVANTPYPTYQGPRVADFTGDQQAGFGMARGAATAGQGALNTAIGATQGALGRSSLGAAQPYLSGAASMSGGQSAAPYLEQGAGMYGQVGQSNSVGAAQPFFGQAAGMSGVGAATPNLQQGANLYSQSTQNLGMQSAQPFLNAAGGSTVGNINTYMNPYQEQVVNRIGQLGQRALRENILPEISDRFIGAGSFGGSRQAEAVGRAVRDASEGISAQQSAALQAGYGQAAGLSAADLARQAQLASTAGQLGTAQQGALQAAGTGMANIGTSLGNLTADQQRALTTLGTSTGQLYGQDITAKGTAGAGLSNIGQTYGQLTSDQQRILSGLGSTAGQLYGADTSAQNDAARQMAAFGNQQQQMGLTGAGALQGIGAQQQALGQKNLDTAYSDFLRQQGYPQEQITGMVGALSGVKNAVPTATLQEGYGPATDEIALAKAKNATSGLQNASTAVATALELKKLFGIG
jgi:hypothetical protein